ncbi:MAG: hypothetical protein ACW97A_10595 [Candidatus Thorarchaeota archaeon]|jgi:hypothetical protein
MTEFCYIHPNTSASGYCAKCGKSVCTECVDAFAGTTECPQCRGVVSGPSSVQKSEERGAWSLYTYIGGLNVRTQLLIGFIGTLILIVGNITPLIADWWITPYGSGSITFIVSIMLLVSNITAFVGNIMMFAGYNALRIRYDEALFLATIVLGLFYSGSFVLVLFMPYSAYNIFTTVVSPILVSHAFPILIGVSFFKIRKESFRPDVVGIYAILGLLLYFGGSFWLEFLWMNLGSLVPVFLSFFALILSFIRTYVFYGEWKRKEEPHWITEEKLSL